MASKTAAARTQKSPNKGRSVTESSYDDKTPVNFAFVRDRICHLDEGKNQLNAADVSRCLRALFRVLAEQPVQTFGFLARSALKLR